MCTREGNYLVPSRFRNRYFFAFHLRRTSSFGDYNGFHDARKIGALDQNPEVLTRKVAQKRTRQDRKVEWVEVVSCCTC